MPTSENEAKRIVEIINEFLTVDQAQEITQRLDDEVGSHTDNSSLRISLKMLKDLYEQTND